MLFFIEFDSILKKILPFLLFFCYCSFSYGAATKNICAIIHDHPSWLLAAKQSQEKWGVPVSIQLAIIKQESDFHGYAKNHKSSAYGYAQALKKPWHSYQKSENTKESRDNFSASSNFIGWYAHNMQDELHISPKNAYALYLAYHDGSGGYKKDLKHKHVETKTLARHVQRVAEQYKDQLADCLKT